VESQIRLGRILGIEIGLHYSWFIVALLLTLSLSARFRATHPDWESAIVWGAALVTGAAFFATLLLHELSHAVTARARGLPVGGITLFALGGVSRLEKDPGDAKTEFLVGIVGPLTSVAIAVACLGLAAALGWRVASEPAGPVEAVLVWLGYINFGLAAFNLIPGFPMDGGRVLRSIVWGLTGDPARATRVAAAGGQVVALLFVVLGLLEFFGGAGLSGLWIAFIGWFLLNAATAQSLLVQTRERLRSIRADEVMTRNSPTVGPGTSLEELVYSKILHTGQRCFLVADDRRIRGLVTLHEIKQVPRADWPRTPVTQVMRRMEDLRVVSPEASAGDCLDTMTQSDVHQVPVVADGEVLGIVTRGDVLRVLQARAELGV